MKKVLTVVGVLLLAAAVASPVLARGPRWGGCQQGEGWGAGPGAGWQRSGVLEGLEEEQRSQLRDLRRTFRDETAELRSQMWVKMGALRALMSASEPNAEQAKALQKELLALRAKVAEKRLDMALQARRIAPDMPLLRGFGAGGFGRNARDAAPGWGAGERGRWSGARQGHYGGSAKRAFYGPGGCW